LAGVASLLAFSAGALVPLLPYLPGFDALAATLVLTAVALVTGGMTVGELTGRPVLRSGLRQLLLGGLAIAVAFAIGHLIGSHGVCPRWRYSVQIDQLALGDAFRYGLDRHGEGDNTFESPNMLDQHCYPVGLSAFTMTECMPSVT
jgi:hypothetical protein